MLQFGRKYEMIRFDLVESLSILLNIYYSIYRLADKKGKIKISLYTYIWEFIIFVLDSISVDVNNDRFEMYIIFC